MKQPDSAAALRVLLTCDELKTRSGLPLYVSELATALKQRGHLPEVFTLMDGPLGDRLRYAGVPVHLRLSGVARPDVIHGNSWTHTILALDHFHGTPGLYVAHVHLGPTAQTPFHPSLRHYFGVSRVCIERLVADGVARDTALPTWNWVDTVRFKVRSPLPAKPKRALIFSNYAGPNGQTAAIRSACERAGIALDVVGLNAGAASDQPETLLGNYDLVFAKARAAMEAVASGCAVILCDFAGLGPMVSVGDYGTLRAKNFGYEALSLPVTEESVSREIARYNPAEAARTTALLRSDAGIDAAVDRMIATYGAVVAESAREPRRAPVRSGAGQLVLKTAVQLARLNPSLKATLRRIPGIYALWLSAVRMSAGARDLKRIAKTA